MTTKEETPLLALSADKHKKDSSGSFLALQFPVWSSSSRAPASASSSPYIPSKHFHRPSSGNNNAQQVLSASSQQQDGVLLHSWEDVFAKKKRIFRMKLWKFHDPLRIKLLFGTMYIFIFIYTLIILFGPIVLSFRNREIWCTTNDADAQLFKHQQPAEEHDNMMEVRVYDNPDYDTDPCRYQRIPVLCYLTLEDCDISRRMLVAVFLGGIVGYERKSADRPAGTRTMGLVSLGACFFTISSMFAFRSSTMGWDASRVTAALPSGVGFLGGALIWKGSVNFAEGEKHQVHGLTTAASVWLSAAIGVGAGGGLYAVTIYSTVMVLLLLKYGPRLYLQDEEVEEEEEEEDPGDVDDDNNDDEDDLEEDHLDQNDENEGQLSWAPEPPRSAPPELDQLRKTHSVGSALSKRSDHLRRSKSSQNHIPTYGS